MAENVSLLPEEVLGSVVGGTTGWVLDGGKWYYLTPDGAAIL